MGLWTNVKCKTIVIILLTKLGFGLIVFETGKPVVHNDFQNLSDKKGYPEGHVNLIRHASVPLYDGDRLRIVLGVGNKATDYDSNQMFY